MAEKIYTANNIERGGFQPKKPIISYTDFSGVKL